MMQKIGYIADRILYLSPHTETDRPVLATIRGKHRTLMIDTGNSPAHADLFINELRQQSHPLPHMAVLTHWHWDHTFGCHQIDVPILAHEETKKSMEKIIPLSWTDEALDARVRDGTENTFCAEMIKKEFGEQRNLTLIPPDITFKKQIELDLGGISCTIEHVGGDHAQDSSVIFVREEKVLFLGDCLYPNLYNQYTINATLLLLDQLQKYDAKTYVLSHEVPLSKSEFHVYVNLLRTLCHLTWKTKGNKERITTTLADQMGGELGPIERMAIDCFVNGIQSSG